MKQQCAIFKYYINALYTYYKTVFDKIDDNFNLIILFIFINVCICLLLTTQSFFNTE